MDFSNQPIWWLETHDCHDRYIILQFTGLKDKNGKEIYKDDYFERNGHIGRVGQADSGLWIVVFDDGKVITLLTDYQYDWQCNKQEVIGNIHENPELSEAKE